MFTFKRIPTNVCTVDVKYPGLQKFTHKVQILFNLLMNQHWSVKDDRHWRIKDQSTYYGKVQRTILGNFGHKLNSNPWQAITVLWQTIQRLRAKRSNIARPIKSQKGVLLSSILCRWRKFVNCHTNPVTLIPSDSQGMRLGADYSTTATKAFLTVETLKAEGWDEIWIKMLKLWTEDLLRWLFASRACHSGGAPKDWQDKVIILINKKGDMRECTNY